MALRLAGWLLLWSGALAAPVAAADLTPFKGATAQDDDAFDVETKAFLMSDYIYRGVSLSQRKPSAGSSVEATWHKFYVGANVQSVDLPTQPASEVTWSAGYRWQPNDFEFDFGITYFWYPGEILADGQPGTSYLEYVLNIEGPLIKGPRDGKDPVTLKAQLAYSPNISGTGAWGAYSEMRLEVALPRLSMPAGVDWQLNAGAGYWRFGDTSPMLGGFALPAYANWLVGVEFNYKDHLLLDLSYVDTNLSREDCFVFTGDTMATGGGVINPVSNPDGLRSRLCGAAFLATLTAKFNLSDLK